jgi:ABC-type oligopeptide transport system substrate-binding subunit/DNA-binding SARP family transcriptional activator
MFFGGAMRTGEEGTVSRLALYLLGPPQFERDGTPLKVRRRRAAALLAYLAVTGEPRSRDALATLFWPEHDRSQARAGLRRTLTSLKKALGGGWLSVDRETVGLNTGAEIWLDVREFQSQLATCHTHGHPPDQVCSACLTPLAEAATLYRDDFLAGFTLPGSPGFDEWQFFQTEGLRQDLAGVLERLARGHSAQGEFEPAIDYARRWVALDPLHEPAHRCLMRLYAWSGQRAAALRQYTECERLLHEELAVSPEEETTQLYEAIQQRRDLPSPVGRKALPVTPTARLQERYRLEAELGRGGMGVIYRAYDTLLERDVAVKVLSEATLDSERRARLLREARAAAKLNHPNVVSVYDVGETEGAPFIVMELVEGEPLGPGQAGAPPEAGTLPHAIAIARQLCAALEHAHAHGIIHRDLKPENVLLARDSLTGTSGQVKLMDFGLAQSMASRVTSEGTVMGTVFYLAPELALGQAYDGRVDLYSLGVILYELTTGRLPFVADDALAVISQHLHAPVVPPRARNAAIPPALDRLIVRLLSKNPEDRPGSAAEVLRLLDAPELLDSEALPAAELSVLERIGRGHIVGRERELQEARALWNQALSGQGGTLLISGEPGVGKTRLVRELVTQAKVSGGTALMGACYAEGGVPYAPFARILQQALKDSVWESLNLPESVLADLLALAPALRLRFPGVPAHPSASQRTGPAVDDPQAEQHRLFENLAIVFAALSEQAPLLLVLEDAHWADSGTIFLLRHLARQMQYSRTMIVATYREVELDDARPLHEVLLDLQRERVATRLKLPRLDREQTRELLAVLFDEEITPEFLAGIYAETEGNPFFIEEVCKALVNSGRLYFQDGRWQRPSMEELGVPQSVRVAIQSRLKALPAEAQETLRLAAILGREFEFDILAEASDQEEGVLIEALEDAQRAQLIEQVSPEAGGTFALVHGLISSTLVESTRTLQRRQLHRRAAAAIEARRPGDGSRLEALAHHYSEAGEGDRAAHYLLQAGDRARELYAYQEAIGHYQQALHYLKEQAARSSEPERDLGRAARTLMKLGLTHHNALEFKAAHQAYEEGFVLWQRAGVVQPATPPPAAPHALRVSLNPPPTILDPAMSSHPAWVAAVDQLFSGLMELTPEMDVVPGVARTWAVSEGGRRYVFHLRSDVCWSDGVPVTAGDFEYAMKRVLDPATGSPSASLLYDIKGARAFHLGQVSDPASVAVRALDPATLVVELEEPAAYFLQLMAQSAAYPVPRHVVEAHGEAWTATENLVTNGPFRLEAWQPGRSMVLTRNPEYHGRFLGNVRRVEQSPPADPSGFLELYEAGSLDICILSYTYTKEVDRVRQQHPGDFVTRPAVITTYLGFDVRRPPFDDHRVRRAFALATDREMLADVSMRGSATPALGGFVPPALPGHSPGIGLPYDPDGARQLLAQAGYPGGSGFPVFDFLAPSDAGDTTDLQAQWREVLQVEIRWKSMEVARFLDRLVREPPRMFLVAWWPDYPDPFNFLGTCPFRRRTGWRHQAYDKLVAEAKGVMDQAVRMKLYQQADRILVEEAPIVPLLYMPWNLLVKPWVTRYPISPMSLWFWKDVILEPH